MIKRSSSDLELATAAFPVLGISSVIVIDEYVLRPKEKVQVLFNKSKDGFVIKRESDRNQNSELGSVQVLHQPI